MPGSRRGVTVHTPTQKINCGRGCGKQNVPLPHTGDVANKTSPCHIQKYYAGIKEKLFICRISSYNNAILYSNYSIE
jgi:hypothetical protein